MDETGKPGDDLTTRFGREADKDRLRLSVDDVTPSDDGDPFASNEDYIRWVLQIAREL